ncbi:hypothetical protein EC604_22455 [Paenibacillus amylolyticus]|uniref:Uncharacterized protein n=1 Tax=Paenibacillus amylolyticus TaxID=1451 RepID=A0A5M9WY55_PAEAM|nr:hypothetical protein [Paenibacillus amylolyticus]KAA8786594.1 hypothetical protein EC604_22455 [Paenibacillus amylolyticus]
MKIKINLSSLIVGLLYLTCAYLFLRYYLPTLFTQFPGAIPVMKEMLNGEGKVLMAYFLIIGVLVGLGASNLGSFIGGLLPSFKKKVKKNEFSL